ncbi:MAG: tyrosine-type recombinase/integrase, partial [Chloroflexi bacterium]|nr:tyrosine-type recombinase/integrase [Chloroflexota bacterium]
SRSSTLIISSSGILSFILNDTRLLLRWPCFRLSKLCQVALFYIIKNTGVTGAHNPHSFRHRFAINFLSSGGDIGVLSKLMGHTSVVVTIRWYGRFAFEELQEQHEKHSLVVQMFGDERNGKNGK